jgi:hypothetical protein
MITTDIETVRFLAVFSIIFLLSTGSYLVFKLLTDRFEKVGFSIMFSLASIAIFGKVFL